MRWERSGNASAATNVDVPKPLDEYPALPACAHLLSPADRCREAMGARQRRGWIRATHKTETRALARQASRVARSFTTWARPAKSSATAARRAGSGSSRTGKTGS